ncbi:hypothetical protein VaNZ11_017115 [Volvox africanus]|uniref:Uncharacterized protein n=1 Tax=Volvox africanus TaxID=51714 RepID=A0ABQ5SQ76_9CHLO|nr:hypothetical protein VaNZ11_017115 [Volvox africanus]
MSSSTAADAAWTKEDLAFLVEAMELKRQFAKDIIFPTEDPSSGASQNKVNGGMSIPKPVTVDCNGDMSEEDFKACSVVMSMCQNIVQKTLTEAAKVNNIPVAEALGNMNAWVQAYVDFPFPFFNYKELQSDNYLNDSFSLQANPEIVEAVCNIKNVPALKDAVIGAVKGASGTLGSYEKTEQHFNYFGVITTYLEREISVRIIKFGLNMKNTVVKTLCGGYEKTHLDSAYDTFNFVGDKQMMIKMQAKILDRELDYMAEKLLQFIEQFYDEELAKWQNSLGDILTQNRTPQPPQPSPSS